MSAPVSTQPTPTTRQRLERALLFLLLVAVLFTYPNRPSFDLDASWRMALGKFFLDDLQFGRDVVFTYGPLGFLMGKTYTGLLFWSLLAWQLFASCSIALLIQYWGQRLAAGWPRLFFYAFFLLYGVNYEDALHMLAIALIGFELVRRVGQLWHWTSALMLLLLATLGVAKFTNLMLAAMVVGTSAALALWQRHPGMAARLPAWFGGGFLAIWVLCGQNPLNLPAYFANSWILSQGYQEVMGIATPDAPLWKAIVVIIVLAGYTLLNVFTQKNRPRSVACGLVLGAFIFLNWKHGFVRSDGHMLGFFYCALLPIVAYPVLLEDADSFGRLKRWALVAAGALCLLGIRDTIPILVDSALAIFQNRIWGNVEFTSRLSTLRQDYDASLDQELQRYGMPRTSAVVGHRSLDVFGYDQAVAIYNKFNYRPRPVFQSYSAYTPELARLNVDYYNSDRAPDFVLLKINSLDQRLPAMDDSALLYLLTQRYKYVLSEKSFQLWEKTSTPIEPAARPLQLERKDLPLDEAWSLRQYGSQPLWVKIDLRPTLLGRLRTFFYKPPMLRLAIQDAADTTTTYRMPAPIGRAGFIINPIVDDMMAFAHFASGTPERLSSMIMIMLAPEDRKYFAGKAHVELSSLKSSTAGQNFFTNLTKERFYMFKTTPVAFEASNKPSTEKIGEEVVMVVHTPSEITFDVPKGTTEVSGRLGFLIGAYTYAGRTNGADFVIVWADGKDTVEIYRRFLDPRKNAEDRGLISFHVDLKRFSGGRLYLRTTPGPYNDSGWDWTAWTDVEIK
ncbi:MAG: hypothetical protein EXS42_00485 [Lacunisphaera sp.]|nr:hypothetical protein [Lacunisphaera sp.]